MLNNIPQPYEEVRDQMKYPGLQYPSQPISEIENIFLIGVKAKNQ